MKKTLSLPRLISLNTYWIGLSFMWNALHPIVLPALLLNFVPNTSKNPYLGLLTFAGLVIAMILQPLAGAVTDNWSSGFGRRRPLMVIGTLMDFGFLTLLGWSGGLLGLVVGYIGLQVSSNLAQGPLQGLMRDQVPEQQLGRASAIKVFMDVASLSAASLVAGRSMGLQSSHPTVIMIVMIALLGTCSAITVFWTREEPSASSRHLAWSDLASQFTVDLRQHSAYWRLIAQRALFLLGVYGVQAFTQYYLQDVLRVPNPPQQTGQLLAAIAAGVLVLVLVGGWLSDRVGPRNVLYAAAVATAAGILLLLFATSGQQLALPGSVLGGGIGLFLTSNWALANRLAPVSEAGKFLGLTNLATAGAAALVRLQGPAIDLLNAARPSAWLGYRGLFIFCAACIVLSTALLRKLPNEGLTAGTAQD